MGSGDQAWSKEPLQPDPESSGANDGLAQDAEHATGGRLVSPCSCHDCQLPSVSGQVGTSGALKKKIVDYTVNLSKLLTVEQQKFHGPSQ
jgi:hypothetical protein